VELKEIKGIIDLMTKNGLTEFELEKADFKIRVKRGPGGEFIPMITPHNPAPVATPIAVPLPTPVATPVASLPAASAPATDNSPSINSPMVGTFYSSPAPGSPSYVEVGKEVTEDTVVCIIEAMKVMNEIKAEMRGVITAVLVENGKPVEFGTPLFKVRPL
jgi:acetyl-CoA carboxylase biotin carboxyl carrier protein